MLSSTSSDARPRVFLHGGPAARPGAGPGLLATGSLEDDFCSAAGLHRRPWLERLRRALARGSFVLHFQPIVSLADGRVSHYEALLRLADEADGSLVAPGQFLPAAERYGLIREIDRMVLTRVIALLGSELRSGGDDLERAPSIAMNVSALSVSDGVLLGHLSQLLSFAPVDPARLVIEITETAAISDMTQAKAFCAGVRALGCAIALDDFGAGFGSFQYLKHLPFDYLKIDGDFIHALPRSHTDQLVVKALVGVVRGLGRQTIAEFVGDAHTLSMLRDYGVDYAQGFVVGRPQPGLPWTAWRPDALSPAAGTVVASRRPRPGR